MKTILMIHGWDYENYTNRCKNYGVIESSL